MTNPRSCKKCGHLNLQATHADLEACPECGAIYARVEAALRDGKTVAPPPQAHQPAPAPMPPVTPTAITPIKIPQVAATAIPPPPIPAPTIAPKEPPSRPYIEELRDQSNYPTFRSFIGFCAGFGYIVAGFFGIAALVSIPKSNAMATSGAFALAIFFYILSKFGKEATLMLADLSDAAVVMAANSKPK